MDSLDSPLSRAMTEAVPARPDGGVSQSPDAAALDNARQGRWEINDDFDGWMLIGVNGRPVMRSDRSQVAFRFSDMARLAAEAELTSSSDIGERKRARPRAGLADLDSGYDVDWTPQTRQSYWADITKSAKLLAYEYVRTTEPEEAVRHAIAVLLNNPIPVREDRINAFVPGRYDLKLVKIVAGHLLDQAVGYQVSDIGSIRDASSSDNAVPTGPAFIKTSSAPLRVNAGEREDISRALRNKGTKLRRERLDSDSLDTSLPKVPPGVDIAANIDEALKKKGNNQWFYNQVNDNGPWDYKRQGKEFEDFGNFNYGATGAALGYTEATLLRMAGWNHAKNNPQGPEHGLASGLPGAYLGIGGEFPFGDDLRDQLWIRRGYRYYMERR